MRDDLERYLDDFGNRLRDLGLADPEIVEEARGHLVDAVEAAMQRGLSREIAQREAIERFGAADLVAERFAVERYRKRDALVALVGAATGVATAWVYSQPVWIPLLLLFAIAGAVHAVMLRRLLSRLRPVHHTSHAHFHDRQFHFAMKSKRGWVNPEVLAIVASPSTELVPFVERVAPRPLLPLGPVQSIDVLEDSARLKRYRVQFGTNPQITCTVMLRPDGKGIALDWSRAE